jgi:nucleotide-binding universal stress UspA family protein
VVATEDARVDVEAAKRIAPECEEHEGRARDVLTVASETADLVVVGSRGLRGLRALGSLSERLAHDARSAVLVVRAR